MRIHFSETLCSVTESGLDAELQGYIPHPLLAPHDQSIIIRESHNNRTCSIIRSGTNITDISLR